MQEETLSKIKSYMILTVILLVILIILMLVALIGASAYLLLGGSI